MNTESSVLWGRAVSLRTALLDHYFQEQNPFSDGWGGIMHYSCAEMDQYPISIWQSHAHITPLLYHQSNPFVCPMAISNQFYVSFAAWVLSNITTPGLLVEALVVVPQCWEWCPCNLHVSITSSCKGLGQIEEVRVMWHYIRGTWIFMRWPDSLHLGIGLSQAHCIQCDTLTGKP